MIGRTYEDFVAAAQTCGLGDVITRIESGLLRRYPGRGCAPAGRGPEGGEREPGGRIMTCAPDKVSGRATARKREDEKILIELPAFSIVVPTNGGVHPSAEAIQATEQARSP